MTRLQTAILDAANAIVKSREMCGDENTAMRDAFADFGIRPTVGHMRKARIRANNIWREYQQQAGVTVPISPEERRQITRIMDNAP